MCYSCLTEIKVTSWASFSHDMGRLASLDGGQSAYDEMGSSSVHDRFQYGLHLASMAQGAPWDDAWRWVSDNVSAAPLSLFSGLANTAPYSMSGVKFVIPTTSDPDVQALFSASQWRDLTITYSFPDSRWDYQVYNPSATGYRSLSFDTQQAIRYALEGYSPYAGGPKMGVSSVEGVTNLSLNYAGRDDATLRISGYDPGDVINRSHAYYPGVPEFNGDTWLVFSSGRPGGYGHFVTLHELGHALGLKHPHDSGGALPKMSTLHDSPEFTVMSYGSFADRPQTYMQYDIAALQAMYGADFVTNSGGTVYTWSPTTGETFVNGAGQGTPYNNRIFLTIWDGGGSDTYDVSNYSEGASIDLAPGGFVKFSTKQLALKSGDTFARANVYNAFQHKGDARSLIENAKGGSGNDKILGNVAANALHGNAGNDELRGGHGDDRLYGGDGNDYLDDALGSSASAGYVFSNDLLDGGNGSDRLNGRYGNDSIYGGNGNDTVDAGDGNDLVYGGADEDLLLGQTGNDTMFGGDGNDLIQGGEGSDSLDGGGGIDTLDYSDATGGVHIDLASNFAYGSIAFRDVILGFENILGGAAGDTLYGDAGANIIYGHGGHDYLYGQDGSDQLHGNQGNDMLQGGLGDDLLHGHDGRNSLWGGAGSDTLIDGGANSELAGGEGRDVFRVLSTAWGASILDFTADEQIQLSLTFFTNFAGVQSYAYQSGADTFIQKGNFFLMIKNAQLSSLAADDFAFI